MAFGGAAGIEARLAGADTVYVAIPVTRLIIGKYTQTSDSQILRETQTVYASAFEKVPSPNPEDITLAISQVAETNPKARGADPREFIEPRLIREIEATGFVKRVYGEQSQ